MLWMLWACTNGTESTPTKDSEPVEESEVVESHDSPVESEPEESEPVVDTAAEYQEYLALYDTEQLHEIVIELDDVALAALAATPYEYTEGIVTLDGERFEKVGVRLRGNAESNNLTDGKPSFRIRLNEYQSGQNVGGVTRLSLNNMNDDRSQVREVLGWWIWAQAGLPAPRAAFTKVSYIYNGETVALGLYANIETPDGNFLDHHMDDATGDLWEAQDSADFTSAGVQHFELTAGDGDVTSLQDTWQAIWTGGDEFYPTADTVLQMDQFLDFWTWSILVGHSGGYPYERNDYYLYADPSVSGRISFVPWDLEGAWDTGMDWEDLSGVVGMKCQIDPACLVTLTDRVEDGLAIYEAMNIDEKASDLYQLTDLAVATDPRVKYTYSEVEAARTSLSYRLSVWPTRIRREVGVR
jgi:spore coat protein CotH